MKVFKKIWVPVVVVLILAVFGSVVYYNNMIKPQKDIDKEVGYVAEDYITLGDYKGIKYELTQEDYDDSINEETEEEKSVDRAAKEGDAITVSYKGYIDGKKDSNISEDDCQLSVGEEQDLYKEFTDAFIGKKTGDTAEIKTTNATYVSADDSDYSGKEVTFKLKLKEVSEIVHTEITDAWVKENYEDDYGLATVKDFYEWNENYILDNAKSEMWQTVVDNATMNGYPQQLYDDVKTEYDSDAAYYADMYGMTTDEYIKEFNGLDEEGLEKEYLNEVKSQLVMWAIVKKEKIKVSSSDIEQKYEDMYADYDYDSVDAMKKDYSKEEIKEAVYLDKAMDVVYDNCKLKKSYKIPDVK